ncbi:hypothetical protein [Actinoplanes awajinensis]|uniref:Uncharacterized protein n=1 Tax=Actinoplanes awajinensis subsp. mycoplanecinus TaxID=135947 RepID=A0A101JQ46_9ACTN|nr:hypothetical protein [Actinoplanes awajinensis]KUL31004.1 hypothetical protein ADL15_23980 [Actinoplanes awajinensis subsp. mycoplanecinus]
MPANTWGFRSVRGVRRPPVEIEVDFGAGPRSLTAGMPVLDLRPATGLTPAEGPIDWTALALLPDTTTVVWSGSDRGLGEALGARPTITALDWGDAAGDLDLRRTCLDRVRLGCAELGSVRLPQSMTFLFLHRSPAGLRVEAPEEGRGLRLSLLRHGAGDVVPAGLRLTPVVRVGAGGEFSAARLAPLANLRELVVEFEAPPGALTEAERLREHPGLQSLTLIDGYGLDPAALPRVDRLHLVGARQATVDELRHRWGDSLTVENARAESWFDEDRRG